MEKTQERQAAGETASSNQFVEEGRRKAESVRKAVEEGRVTLIRWSSDGSCCEFLYKGIDNHGMPSEFLTTLNKNNAIAAISGIWLFIQPKYKKEGGAA